MAAGRSRVLVFGVTCAVTLALHAQPAERTAVPAERPVPGPPLPRLEVHAGGHFLQTNDGRPFFWLADTAWQLVHATTRSEATYYLNTRARQGFTVIQTVALAEFDGILTPSALGLRPFAGEDPSRPDAAYFDRIVEIVDEAAALGLYVALVPTWGDKLTASWGAGPRIFRLDNLPVARAYGEYLGLRLADRTNVVWLLGGDRPPRLAGMHNDGLQRAARDAGFGPGHDWTPIWREMAAGIAAGGGRRPLIAYHPQGGPDSSSVFLHQEPWLSVNGMQSGHGGGRDQPVWEWVARDWALLPPKPTLDLEPNYEDHPYNPWPRWDPASGYFRDDDVRKQTYRSVFAGGAGVTYGHHAVWQFASARNGIVNHADRDWLEATSRPAARQMVHLRHLMESRPFFTRVPDPALLPGDPGPASRRAVATRDDAGTYAFVYVPTTDQVVDVDLRRLRAARVLAWWYDPRTGIAREVDEIEGGARRQFRSPAHGPDWVLVLDDVAAGYPPPGIVRPDGR
jgi:hypothetical protein